MEEKNLNGVLLTDLYNYDLNEAYEFVKKNTDYLKEIKKTEVKQIEFSYYKDIVILMNNGELFINNKLEDNNIKRIFFQDGTKMYTISNRNVIKQIISKTMLGIYMNNSDYEYKKILIDWCSMAALTFEGTVRCITPPLNVGIDSNRFINVDDLVKTINSRTNDTEFVVKQNGKLYSLFILDQCNNQTDTFKEIIESDDIIIHPDI